MNRFKTILLLFSIVFANIVFVGTASADVMGADIFTPGENDWFMKFFVDPYINPNNVTVFSGLMYIFQHYILILAGSLAAYTLIAGTMSTAHDGVILGKKWSSMWLPVRTALGTAMIIPVANGYSAINYVIYSFIKMGVGLAFLMVPIAVASLTNLMSYSSVSATLEVRKLVKDTLLGTACVQLYNNSVYRNILQMRQAGLTPDNIRYYSVQNFSATSSTGRVVGYKFGGPKDFMSGDRSQLCGFVNLEITNEGELQKQLASQAGYKPLVDSASVQSAVQEAQVQALAKLTQEAMAYAPTLINTDPDNMSTLNTKIEALSNEYSDAMKVAGKVALVKATQVDAIAEITDKGWAFFGAYYMKIVQSMNQVSAAVNSIPSSSGQLDPTLDDSFESPYPSSDFKPKYERVQKMLNTADAYNGDTTDMASQDSSLFTKFVKGMSSSGGVFFGDGNTDQLLSITQQVNVGNHVLNGVGVSGIFVSSVSLLAVIPRLSDVLIAAGTVVGPFFSALMLIGMVNGIMLAYVIPMIPYIIWMGIIVSYMATCVEAQIAAPMWVMAHLAPDADDIVGKQGQGYMLTVILSLKPGLSVFGFVASFVMMSAGALLINATFLIATSFVASGWLGLCYSIAMVAVYMTLNLNNTMNATRVMSSLPDSILEWFGARGTQLAGKVMGGSEEAVQNAKGNASEATGKMAQAASQANSQYLASMKRKPEPKPTDPTNTVDKGDNGQDTSKPTEPKAPSGNNGTPLKDL